MTDTITRLRDLLAGTSSAPWITDSELAHNRVFAGSKTVCETNFTPSGGRDFDENRHNAELIVAMHAALPLLLDCAAVLQLAYERDVFVESGFESRARQALSALNGSKI